MFLTKATKDGSLPRPLCGASLCEQRVRVPVASRERSGCAVFSGLACGEDSVRRRAGPGRGVRDSMWTGGLGEAPGRKSTAGPRPLPHRDPDTSADASTVCLSVRSSKGEKHRSLALLYWFTQMIILPCAHSHFGSIAWSTLGFDCC